jgi:hypothetical protein
MCCKASDTCYKTLTISLIFSGSFLSCDPMKAIGYVRISTDRQAEQGHRGTDP